VLSAQVDLPIIYLSPSLTWSLIHPYHRQISKTALTTFDLHYHADLHSYPPLHIMPSRSPSPIPEQYAWLSGGPRQVTGLPMDSDDDEYGYVDPRDFKPNGEHCNPPRESKAPKSSSSGSTAKPKKKKKPKDSATTAGPSGSAGSQGGKTDKSSTGADQQTGGATKASSSAGTAKSARQ
jgi:hypothetical protein